MFLKNYLDNFSLSQCAKFTGISNGSAAVYWGSFMRENFKGLPLAPEVEGPTWRNRD